MFIAESPDMRNKEQLRDVLYLSVAAVTTFLVFMVVIVWCCNSMFKEQSKRFTTLITPLQQEMASFHGYFFVTDSTTEISCFIY